LFVKMTSKKIKISILALLGLLLLGIIIYFYPRNYQVGNYEATAVVTDEPILFFDLPIDSFNIQQGKIKRNQYLGQIFKEYGVPENKIQEISLKSKGIINPKSIKAGNKYILFFSPDSESYLQHFVYEIDAKEYLSINLKDSVTISVKSKNASSIIRYFDGTISSSLWATMQENNTNPMLAIMLSEIYAWTIDFFMLDKNDRIRVLYEEELIDGKPVNINRIMIACFTHYGNDYYAIPFVQDDMEDYFDEHGNSLRKQFLKAPLRFSRISSKFSHSRLHPILRIRRPHYGVDYAAPSGTPVQSVGNGIVIEANYRGGAGKYIKIRHNNTYTTAYLHLSKFGKGIYKGAKIQQGQIIGYVGSTGHSTGPHLDFRFWKNGLPVDPLKVKSPPALPVKKENLEPFEELKNYWTTRLNRYIYVIEDADIYD
jgi:murein DD-endopeptidase MepM/ murein hydrolase activator NlpD